MAASESYAMTVGVPILQSSTSVATTVSVGVSRIEMKLCLLCNNLIQGGKKMKTEDLNRLIAVSDLASQLSAISEGFNDMRFYTALNDIIDDIFDLVNAELLPTTTIEVVTKLNLKVDSLNFPTKARNLIFKPCEIEKVKELVAFNKNDLLKFRGIGKRTLREIDRVIVDELGLCWGMRYDEIISKI